MPITVRTSERKPSEFPVETNKIVRITKTVPDLNPVTFSVVDKLTQQKNLFLNNQPSLTLIPNRERGKLEFVKVTSMCKYMIRDKGTIVKSCLKDAKGV